MAAASNHAGERRASILRAAEKLLEHYGFGKTTVADIAREARVGVGTVYLEFESKNAIVAELSQQRYRCVLEAMRQAATGDGPAAERLRALFDARITRLSRFAHQGPHGRDLMHCGGCPGTQAARAAFRAAEEDLLTEFLQAAAGAGELTADSPREAARVLLRLYDSYTAALASAGESTSTGALARELAVAHLMVARALLISS